MQETIHNLHNQGPKEDQIEVSLRTIAQNILIAIFGFLPVFFIPVNYVPLEYAKTVIVIVGVLATLVFFSLSVLRSGVISIASPVALLAFWGMVGVTLLSALLSGDIRDSFIGDTFGVHTALFMLLLGAVATVVVVVGRNKAHIMRLYLLLSASAVLLTVYHVVRLLFGPDTLSFGLFGSAVSSPIGGWNQLGLFFGLVILLALVALEQLPLTKWGNGMFSAVIALSLVMLGVVNFVAVWAVLALVSLIVLMYTLTKDRFASEQMTKSASTTSIQSVMVATLVFVTSLVFIIGGTSVGTQVSEWTGINYVEVRPSVEATIDIGRSVYGENAFVGVGPNKFADAWRLYKDTSINQTVFWDTEFIAGSGFLPTYFVSTGIFGLIAFLIFAFFFIRAGILMLVLNQPGDRFWYFIASSSFVAAVYLWGMSFVYVTGTTMLLLAAVFTGITCVAYTAIVPTRSFEISVFSNRRSGIVLVGVVMVIIVISSAALYYTTRHYGSVATFNQALLSVQPGASVENLEQEIASAYTAYANDAYARQLAQYQIAKMNTLLAVREPSAEQQQQFQEAAANGVNAANLAIENDATDPRNHSALGTIFGILAAAGVEDVADRAFVSFESARQYDPTNPQYDFLEAQLRVALGDAEAARTSVIKAVQLKPDHTDALFLLTQIDIASGNVEEAIAATEAIVSFQPNDPARFYQLGVLYSAHAQIEAAVGAFERAIGLDPEYANAHYFLALAYAELGQVDAAISQLEIVRDLNPENAVVQQAIDQLENAEAASLLSSSADAQPVDGTESAAVAEGGTVVSDEDLDSSLVTPVNVVPADTTEDVEVSETE